MSENQEPQPVPAETKDWVAVLDTGVSSVVGSPSTRERPLRV